MKIAVAEGRQKTLRPGGITKGFWFENITGEKFWLHGSWEMIYADYLNRHGILWIKNKIGFKYFYENQERTYFPDFYLENENLYVEVKGYETEKDIAKWKYFPHKLRIIRKKEINEIKEKPAVYPALL